MKTYIADFETRAGEEAIKEGLTYVWAWAIADIEDFKNPKTGNTIDEFFALLKKFETSDIYFHNLKFDGRFILDYLLRRGYTHVDRARAPGEFETLISEDGVFYSLAVCLKWRARITFKDSLKKLPFAVKKLAKDFKTEYQKLELDYIEERPEHYEMDEEEEEYIKNDVRVVGECLLRLYEDGRTKMTASGDCMDDFKARFTSKFGNFRQYFPELEAREDEFVRKSYRGGWCYVDKPGYYEGEGSTYDVNSLYPSMMHSISGNVYPYGPGIYYQGLYKLDDECPLYVQHAYVWAVLKEGYLPTIQLKHSLEHRSNEWVKDTKGPQEVYLTSVDLEMLCKHYEILSFEPIDGYKYRAAKGFFDDYIDFWMSIKKTSKGAKRALAKLMLNGLYGKFGQKVKGSNKIPVMKDSVVKFVTTEETDRKPVYIPIAAFVTSYSRRFTITAAQKNYKNFIYADTDSIHCIGEVTGIDIDDCELCCWKHESDWSAGKFVRQKTYAERMDMCGPGEFWDIKCAGMNEESKHELKLKINRHELTIEDFDIGLKITGKKLRPKPVKGGIILVPTDFEIKENAFLY